MSLQLSIPDEVLSAIRLPETRIEKALLQELAIALYAQELLSLGAKIPSIVESDWDTTDSTKW